jgi:hypothetical protein
LAIHRPSPVICKFLPNFSFNFIQKRTRYLGPSPSNGSERLPTDQNRVIFRVVLATNTLTLPSASAEPIDYEGPAWNANEDFLLLKVGFDFLNEEWEL